MFKIIWRALFDNPVRHPGDLSQHRQHTHLYEDMCM